MQSLQSIIGLLRWAGHNTAYNLEFIPADRLAWKPAPTAASALEIVAHVSGVLQAMTRVLVGEEWTMPAAAPPGDLEEARSLLLGSVRAYAEALERVAPETLQRTAVVSPARIEVPLARAVAMPVVDLIHHHGQIAYLQTLLGDPEPHFHELGRGRP